MADIVKVDGKTIRVDIEEQDDTLVLSLGGTSKEVKIVEHDRAHMTLIIDDRPFDIVFAGDDVIIVNNEEYSVSVFDEQVEKMMKTSGASLKKQELIIKAAMPGLIIDVNVKEGDHVHEGQGLLIIEAMKMQNEMQSTRTGVVKKINIEKGQTVNSGDKLIIIE